MRRSVLLFVVMVGACDTITSPENELVKYANRQAQRAKTFERELGECRAQLASRGSAQSAVAQAAAPPLARTIDFGLAPHIPDGWSIRLEDQITSAVRGKLQFDPTKVGFHLEEAQKTRTIVGTELRKQLEGKPVLPANVLDHLLANTDFIPESWKQDEQGQTRYIYFWGTIYRVPGGYLYVRYLYWDDGQWRWSHNYLTYGFDDQDMAALLAS